MFGDFDEDEDSGFEPDEPEPSAADVIARLHVLIAEAARCLDDDRAEATRGKLAYADYLLRELAAKLSTPDGAKR